MNKVLIDLMDIYFELTVDIKIITNSSRYKRYFKVLYTIFSGDDKLLIPIDENICHNACKGVLCM